MKPVPLVTIWWLLLLGTTQKCFQGETAFYYGTFPAGTSICVSVC